MLPDICRVVNLITLMISEDEGSQRHVINFLSDPVHLGHHPVHFAYILTWNGKCYLNNSYLSVYLKAIARYPSTKYSIIGRKSEKVGYKAKPGVKIPHDF